MTQETAHQQPLDPRDRRPERLPELPLPTAPQPGPVRTNHCPYCGGVLVSGEGSVTCVGVPGSTGCGWNRRNTVTTQIYRRRRRRGGRHGR